MQPIRVYEHTSLKIDNESQFKQLVKFNELHKNKYFSVGNQRIYFNSYVGVIQVGDLIIEIIPKADNNPNEEKKDKWRNVLLNMLRECKIIKIDSVSDANLKIRNSSMIDLFFHKFLAEVEHIVHTDLVKNYRKLDGLLNVIKGKILFDKNITKNPVHKEKVYIRFQIYDKNNLLNRILKTALMVLLDNTKNFS